MTEQPMKFWSWGREGEGLNTREADALLAATAEAIGAPDGAPLSAPSVGDFDVPAPRVQPPDSLTHLCTSDPKDRLIHSFGKSFADTARPFLRQLPCSPDVIAYPDSEQDVADLMEWADGANVAVIPFGGGSSVCGGVEPAVGDGYAGVVTIDLKKLDKVLEIDPLSRAARIQAGAYGPALEAQIKPSGLTLRHFPQSFEYSSLGGWIATRSGGHYASVYTHIDDFVESVRTVTPAGVMESRRLPGSGAGPSPDRLMIGSEGAFGIITEAWMRLQHKPKFQSSIGIGFTDFYKAAEAVRALSQSALFPTNCRLIDANEVRAMGAGDSSLALMVLGFESADHPADAWMARALEIVDDHGGVYDRKLLTAEGSNKAGAAGAWRHAFIRAPFFREHLVPRGYIMDTFETSITWERFPGFHANIMTAVANAIKEITGAPGTVTCRFTHVYPDGPAPYFSFSARSTPDKMLDQWLAIKVAASEAVNANLGTITHHHAVGRDHKPWYDQQIPDLFRSALQGAKSRLDPNGIMNPGVIVDPAGTPLGAQGVIAGASIP
ncbi:MAG: FAD-binding oxidoreductase [Rhodospirillales bacterium]|nr:FAD-binding oxidoreductase [Rhodospirillales bacterium]